MQYALVGDERREGEPGLAGVCPVCGSPVLPRCGEVRVRHWAHRGRRDCDTWWEPETVWHRRWKNRFPKDWQEVIGYDDTGEQHRADVKTENDLVIEFQHSHLDPKERAARETFYGDMVWVVGIDADYVLSHYRSTVERLGRFRRRFQLDQAVLDRALDIEPPLATDPVPSHTRPMPSKFVVDEESAVTLTDWEWATLGPPEWDLTLAVWQFASINGEDAAAAFRKGYAAELPESRYRSWVAYHAAMMMLDAAETREGRLGDLSYLVDDLTQAVLGN